jgi:hypothetical protein
MRVESPADIAYHSSTRFSMRFSAAIPLVFRKTVDTFEHVLESALESTAARLDETSAPQAFNTVHSSPQGQIHSTIHNLIVEVGCQPPFSNPRIYKTIQQTQ